MSSIYGFIELNFSFNRLEENKKISVFLHTHKEKCERTFYKETFLITFDPGCKPLLCVSIEFMLFL